ncbi:hypothetical protein ANANG_G00294220 [Anguilla anguilla]|uniref:Zinc finger protein 750 n=1 Tax=Anguilla anguilla TaxID=7936 RepID=A0A9D3LLM4_ANGAN|nr:hypothetical protein ANANG_G00294220 [Anguilla anguilla]
MTAGQARKPKRPHYVPRPPGKPFRYQCFQCPFTCNEKSHLFNHLKYDLCKDSIALVTGLRGGRARRAKAPAPTPAPRRPRSPRRAAPPRRGRAEGAEGGAARDDGTSHTRTPEENPSLPVLSPPFYRPTLTWGHPTEFTPPGFQREDLATCDYPHPGAPGYPTFVPPEHPLLIYRRSVLPWDTDGTRSPDHQGPLHPTPPPLLLTEHPYGYYPTLHQTPPHRFELHCTPKQLLHSYPGPGYPNREAHSRHPWLVYPVSDQEGDPRSVPAWAAHWGMGGREWAWPGRQDWGMGRESRMSPRQACSALGSPDRPGQSETDSPLYSSLGEEGLRSTYQSGDSTPHTKPIRWSVSSVSSQQEGTVLQARRSARGSLGHPISYSAEEEEDEEFPLNLSTKDWTEEERTKDFHTSRGRHASKERTPQNTTLNLALRESLGRTPESSLHPPDGETSEARRHTAALALCLLAGSCSDRLNNATTPSTCGEAAASAQRSHKVKGQRRPGCEDVHRSLQRHPKRPKTAQLFPATSRRHRCS